MKGDAERHARWQGIYHRALTALAAQDVLALNAAECEELSWNLADATAAQRTWDDVRAGLLRELTHHGAEQGHGRGVLPAVAQVLLGAVHDDPEASMSGLPGSSGGWLARGRAARTARRRCWYTVTPWSVDAEADRVVLRAVLASVRPWAGQVQCDLPLAERAHWPPAVADAADHLARVCRRHRGEEAGYATTGWLPAGDEAHWQAFVIFVPYALDADVVTSQAGALVEVTDEGTSVALRLDARQHAAVASVLQDRQLQSLP